MAFAGTVCPVTRQEFDEHAKSVPVAVQLNGIKVDAEVKNFSTGSIGWGINEKRSIQINGKEVKVQIGLNVTVVNSKDLP
jgi:hypothetical protein